MIKRYKQYYWFQAENSIIISSQKMFKPEYYDDPCDPFHQEPFRSKANYRPMHIAAIDKKWRPYTSTENIQFHLNNDWVEDINIARYYVRAVFNDLPGWFPAIVRAHGYGGVHVGIVKHNNDGEIVDFEWINIYNIPLDMRLLIDIDATPGFEAERYVIRSVLNGPNVQPESCSVVDEYKGRILQRTRKLCKEDDGYYELITEA